MLITDFRCYWLRHDWYFHYITIINIAQPLIATILFDSFTLPLRCLIFIATPFHFLSLLFLRRHYIDADYCYYALDAAILLFFCNYAFHYYWCIFFFRHITLSLADIDDISCRFDAASYAITLIFFHTAMAFATAFATIDVDWAVRYDAIGWYAIRHTPFSPLPLRLFSAAYAISYCHDHYLGWLDNYWLIAPPIFAATAGCFRFRHYAMPLLAITLAIISILLPADIFLLMPGHWLCHADFHYTHDWPLAIIDIDIGYWLFIIAITIVLANIDISYMIHILILHFITHTCYY